MPTPLDAFLTRWHSAGGRGTLGGANYQLFLTELCDLLQLPHPEPSTPDDSKNNYVFDRSITATNPDGTTSPNFIDLYKRNHFVLETKQGIERNAGILPASSSDIPPAKPAKLKRGHGIRGSKLWDDSLLRAKAQAESYVRNLPDDNPPFLLVADVGYSFETYSDFSGLGKTYTPFPDNLSHRFKLTDLADPVKGPPLLDRLKKIWTDPQSLNPARRTAKVTRDIAAKLAQLSQSLEKSKHSPEQVAHFLMRVLFTLFAEDVHLIPNNAFTKLLEDLKDTPDKFAPMAQAVWQNMDKGGFSPVLREDLLRFNGGLFADTQALKLTGNQLELLLEAAKQDWSDVEPAIFGTLLERALDPTERHKLGAHYTPRAYVERLVLPTVIEPLRDDWRKAQSTAIQQANKGDLKQAIKTIGQFLKQLCSVTILDPACGSGNFLYVTLEHLKRLEGEVHDFLSKFPNTQLPLEYTGLTVDPHQLRGIEINPRAAAITDLVLWIGYLQWHFRTHGKTMPSEPVLKKFDNIECRDAVLAYDKKELARDEHGKPLSRWDDITYKKHPATGEDVPDESARVPIYRFVNARKAVWPNTDYVLGNPPFIGNKRMRIALGDGYVDALHEALQDIPATVDFVMYWWDHAAELAKTGAIQRFGFITTNSITQPFNRVILEHQMMAAEHPINLAFAIPDHPWSDAEQGAAVRIAMTVGTAAKSNSVLCTVASEQESDEESRKVELLDHPGPIHSDLTVGANSVTSLNELSANTGLCAQGVIVLGDGFLLDDEDCSTILADEPSARKLIKRYRNGKDLTDIPRGLRIIDLHGLSEDQLKQYPVIYQRIYDRVRPARLQMKDKARREKWWLFGRSNNEIRAALKGLTRYIATCRTAKHRIFMFLEGDILPDAKIVAIGLDEPFFLGVLSSRLHTQWALRTGAFLEDRPNYNHADCFNKFPFPDCTEKQKARIRKIAEELDAHRKRQQQKFPDLTLTDMYNVLQKLRTADRNAGVPPASPIPNPNLNPNLNHVTSVSSVVNPSPPIHSAAFSPKDKQIHDHGLISILQQLHEELDAAVFDAYGWPQSLTDDQLLENLVTLNHHRAAEEKSGLIKYLRPNFQSPRPT